MFYTFKRTPTRSARRAVPLRQIDSLSAGIVKVMAFHSYSPYPTTLLRQALDVDDILRAPLAPTTVPPLFLQSLAVTAEPIEDNAWVWARQAAAGGGGFSDRIAPTEIPFPLPIRVNPGCWENAAKLVPSWPMIFAQLACEPQTSDQVAETMVEAGEGRETAALATAARPPANTQTMQAPAPQPSAPMTVPSPAPTASAAPILPTVVPKPPPVSAPAILPAPAFSSAPVPRTTTSPAPKAPPASTSTNAPVAPPKLVPSPTKSASVSPEMKRGGESGVVPRQRSALTFADCAPLFHLPVESAASLLGVSRPTIARVMRANGVKRWPYRAVRAAGVRSVRRGVLKTSPRDPGSAPRMPAQKGPQTVLVAKFSFPSPAAKAAQATQSERAAQAAQTAQAAAARSAAPAPTVPFAPQRTEQLYAALPQHYKPSMQAPPRPVARPHVPRAHPKHHAPALVSGHMQAPPASAGNAPGYRGATSSQGPSASSSNKGTLQNLHAALVNPPRLAEPGEPIQCRYPGVPGRPQSSGATHTAPPQGVLPAPRLMPTPGLASVRADVAHRADVAKRAKTPPYSEVRASGPQRPSSRESGEMLLALQRNRAEAADARRAGTLPSPPKRREGGTVHAAVAALALRRHASKQRPEQVQKMHKQPAVRKVRKAKQKAPAGKATAGAIEGNSSVPVAKATTGRRRQRQQQTQLQTRPVSQPPSQQPPPEDESIGNQSSGSGPGPASMVPFRKRHLFRSGFRTTPKDDFKVRRKMALPLAAHRMASGGDSGVGATVLAPKDERSAEPRSSVDQGSAMAVEMASKVGDTVDHESSMATEEDTPVLPSIARRGSYSFGEETSAKDESPHRPRASPPGSVASGIPRGLETSPRKDEVEPVKEKDGACEVKKEVKKEVKMSEVTQGDLSESRTRTDEEKTSKGLEACQPSLGTTTDMAKRSDAKAR